MTWQWGHTQPRELTVVMHASGGFWQRISLYFPQVKITAALVVYNSWRSILYFVCLMENRTEESFLLLWAISLPPPSFLWEEALWSLLLHCCATHALKGTMPLLPCFLVMRIFPPGTLKMWCLYLPPPRTDGNSGMLQKGLLIFLCIYHVLCILSFSSYRNFYMTWVL